MWCQLYLRVARAPFTRRWWWIEILIRVEWMLFRAAILLNCKIHISLHLIAFSFLLYICNRSRGKLYVYRIANGMNSSSSNISTVASSAVSNTVASAGERKTSVTLKRQNNLFSLALLFVVRFFFCKNNNNNNSNNKNPWTNEHLPLQTNSTSAHIS